MPVRIQRRRTRGWKMPSNTVYVGRPTKWGNDLQIGDKPGCGGMVNCPCLAPCAGATAEDCVQFYRDTRGQEWWFKPEELEQIRGKNLACWCPLISQGKYVPCHADVLLSIANEIPMEEVIRENTRWAKGEAV